jgi:uroporphyrinogen decarboxylase
MDELFIWACVNAERSVRVNSKERVTRALKRTGLPDRVPIQFDLSRPLLEAFSAKHGIPLQYSASYYEDLKYRISANDLRTAMGSDCVVVGGGLARIFKLYQDAEGFVVNEFGMRMRQGPLYMEVIDAPLREASSVGEVDRYQFPDAYDPARYRQAEADIARYGHEYFIIGDCELTIFELCCHLVGMQKYLEALAQQEAYAEALLTKAFVWSLGIATSLAKRGVDAIWFGDDFGSQTGLMISPQMWRRLFKPLYAQLFRTVKRINPEIIVMMHSDGAVAPLLPDLIEIGLEVFNPVQPGVPGHDPRELKARFGDQLAFFGAIDQQHLLPNGSVAEIEADVRTKIAVLGKGGGYMIAPAHIIQADTSVEQVEAFIAAARKYGNYA